MGLSKTEVNLRRLLTTAPQQQNQTKLIHYVATLREQLEQLAEEKTPEGLPRISKVKLNEYSEQIEALAAKLAAQSSAIQVSLETANEPEVEQGSSITEEVGAHSSPSRGLRRRSVPHKVEDRTLEIAENDGSAPIKLDAATQAHIEKHRKLQEDLTDEMVVLAQQLKESSLVMNKSLQDTEKLINHGIPVELLDGVKKVCSECFKLYREQRFKDSAPVQLLNDLMGGKKDETGERLKNTDWEDVFVLLDTNEWPSQPAEFKEIMKEYRRELKKLAEKMMEIMDENLGLEKGYIKKVFCGGEGLEHEPFFGTKVSHYPPCPNPDQVIGLRAHTDAGGVILLFQDDQVKGLQILKDGQWIDVQPMANAIVINTGDQIEVVSNGRYKSVWHRVLASHDGNRRSIASFYNPSAMATMTPAPKLVGQTDEDAQAYPKFVFGDYMTVYGDQKFLPKEPRFKAAAAM